jgi:glycerophosphoryl diester phosphodiesterase
MALSPDGSMLFPMLEHPLRGVGDVLNVYAFDLAEGRYTTTDPDSATYRYRLDAQAISVAEITARSGNDFLVIERDGEQGPSANFKRVFLMNRLGIDAAGVVEKIQLIDLLDIADPHDLTRSGTGHLRFDFETVEALVIVDDSTVGLINDNNYPLGRARLEQTGAPDPTEFILVRIRRPR